MDVSLSLNSLNTWIPSDGCWVIVIKLNLNASEELPPISLHLTVTRACQSADKLRIKDDSDLDSIALCEVDQFRCIYGLIRYYITE